MSKPFLTSYFAVALLGATPASAQMTFAAEQQAQRHCPTDIVVWLNIATRTYSTPGTRSYGHSNNGAYVCEREADMAGERPSPNDQQTETPQDRTDATNELSWRADVRNLILQIALSALVGIGASLVTARVALRQFYREKWWEAKMAAYSSLFDALHQLNRSFEWGISEYYGPEPDRANDRPHSEIWAEVVAATGSAWSAIEKGIDTGQFLLCDESVATLRGLLGSYHYHFPRETDLLERLQGYFNFVNDALEDLRASARKDLGLPALKPTPKLKFSVVDEREDDDAIPF